MKFRQTLSLAAIFLTLTASKIFADCPLPGTPSEELKRATAVFSGKVVGTERRKITDEKNEDFGGEQEFVKLKVKRWWKGDGGEEITLRTSRIYFTDSYKESGEGFFFSNGDTYLIYAFFYNGEFGTSDCTRTIKFSAADKDLAELGAGFAPSVKEK
jgi:hypothetical protein